MLFPLRNQHFKVVLWRYFGFWIQAALRPDDLALRHLR
jgi:hypothetical protein